MLLFYVVNIFILIIGNRLKKFVVQLHLLTDTNIFIMEGLVWLEDIEVGANFEVHELEPRVRKCRVTIPKLMVSQSPLKLPNIYCTACLKDTGRIKAFHQSSNLKVHIGYVHAGYEDRRFVCNTCTRRFVTKQDLGYHERKRVCNKGKVIKWIQIS